VSRAGASAGFVLRPCADARVFRIKAADTNRFVMLVDPMADGTAFVSVVEIFDVGGRTPPNVHTRADELFFVLSGRGRVTCDGVVRDVSRGDAVLVRRGQMHVVENTGAVRLYCLTTMVPDEDFAALIREGVPDALDDIDLAVLGSW